MQKGFGIPFKRFAPVSELRQHVSQLHRIRRSHENCNHPFAGC
jgi:hypothetical protein